MDQARFARDLLVRRQERGDSAATERLVIVTSGLVGAAIGSALSRPAATSTSAKPYPLTSLFGAIQTYLSKVGRFGS